MLKYIKSLFTPTRKIYTYKLSKDMLVKRIEAIFSEKATFLSFKDVNGYFISKNTFTIEMLSTASEKIFYNSTLIAVIKEQPDNSTQIEIKVTPGLLFFLAPVANAAIVERFDKYIDKELKK